MERVWNIDPHPSYRNPSLPVLNARTCMLLLWPMCRSLALGSLARKVCCCSSSRSQSCTHRQMRATYTICQKTATAPQTSFHCASVCSRHVSCRSLLQGPNSYADLTTDLPITTTEYPYDCFTHHTARLPLPPHTERESLGEHNGERLQLSDVPPQLARGGVTGPKSYSNAQCDW